jgi:hypothetical protein
MLAMIWTHNATPALVVDFRQHEPLVGQPTKDRVAAIVAYGDPAVLGGVWLGWRDAQSGADIVQQIFAVGVKLDQTRLKMLAALLQVDAASPYE